MSRYPPIPPSQQIAEQRDAQDQLQSLGTVFGSKRIVTADSEGTLHGPYVPLLYTPSICKPFISLASAVLKFPHITPRIRELAILATASFYEAPFVLHARSSIAQSIGFSVEQVADAKAGRALARLDSAEDAAWQFAMHLTRTPHFNMRLDQKK